MSEHPILFSGTMVKAILEGRKTQTRRVVTCGMEMDGDESGAGLVPVSPCPYGLPGDELWVRETWQAMNQERRWWHEVKRDDRPLYNWAWTNPVYPAYESQPPKWLPSIHMPRAASRITLDVSSVRVERLQDISEGDAKAEGVGAWHDTINGTVYRPEYQLLWDSINGKRPGCAWQDNPLVWVVEFAKR